MKTSNKNARTLVQSCKPFKGSNTYGEVWDKGCNADLPLYVVFSYGSHFPLFIYKGGKWFGNIEKYSPSTSRHFRQLNPHPARMEMRDTLTLKQMLNQHINGM